MARGMVMQGEFPVGIAVASVFAPLLSTSASAALGRCRDR